MDCSDDLPKTGADGEITLNDCFDYYDQRFARAASEMPLRLPWSDQGRSEIRTVVRRCLGIHDEWIPAIEARAVHRERFSGYSVECLQFESWPQCHGSAWLYGPETSTGGPLPIVLIACGHGIGGKNAYRTLAENLARSGCYALIPDNIGQGEREAMGHRDVVGVFERGLSVQGLIVMETMGWLNWIKAQTRFDSSRIAVAGNSGGGTLSHFLGALCSHQLSAVACSGYPGSYAWIHRKEKKLCHCNVLPGIVAELEMWQVLGAIAPLPLFIFQGKEDSLFPTEMFWQTARKVHFAYQERGAAAQLSAEVYPGGHSWDRERRLALIQWLCDHFGTTYNPDVLIDPSEDTAPPLCFDRWPDEARTTDALAELLTGKNASATRMAEIFPPAVKAHESRPPFMRADVTEIFAQFEAGLKK